MLELTIRGGQGGRIFMPDVKEPEKVTNLAYADHLVAEACAECIYLKGCTGHQHNTLFEVRLSDDLLALMLELCRIAKKEAGLSAIATQGSDG